MFSALSYKIIHLFGIFMVFVALGGICLHAAIGGAKNENSAQRLVSIIHGLGILLIILGGFGMLARLGIMHNWIFPGWVWTKVVIWLALGLTVGLPYRWPRLAKPLLIILPLLGGLAAVMAIYKPF